MAVVGGVGLVVAGGCSTGQRGLPGVEVVAAEGESAIRIEADWADVEAAVTAALGQSELVRVRLDRPDPSQVVYALRTSRDEPATLTIARLDGPGALDPVRLRLVCRVGRFGDAAREGEFLALVADRLRQLRGVEVAPLRE